MPTDNFNRSNTWPGGGLGANWTIMLNGGLDIFGNEAIGSTSANCLNRWSADSFANDQYSRVTIGDSDRDKQGPGVRLSGSGATSSGYVLSTWLGFGWQLYRVDAGAFTEIAADTDGSHAYALGDVAELQVSGTSLTVLKNGSAVTGMPVTDATYGSGAAGIYANTTSGRLEQWEGGDLGGGSGTVGKRLLKSRLLNQHRVVA